MAAERQFDVFPVTSDHAFSGILVQADLSIVLIRNGAGLSLRLAPDHALELARVLAHLALANDVRPAAVVKSREEPECKISREVGHA